MSYPDPKNPYSSSASPPVITSGLGGYPDRIDYMRSYNYIFESPNWAMNVLWGFLCVISTSVIPVVGQLVLLGYSYEVIEALCLSRGARFPDFDLNRFGDYLTRSIWPFLVNLVAVIPILFVGLIGVLLVILPAAAGGALGGDNLGPVLATLFGGLGFVVLTALMFAVAAILLPMMLRAGLMQEFGAAFDFEWAIDFVKKIWIEILLVFLFVVASGLVLGLLGLFALCIGIYAAAAIVTLANAHLTYQLYMVYLSRGGKPIPFKPVAVATPQVPPITPPVGPVPPRY